MGDAELCTACSDCVDARPAGHIYVGSDGVAHKYTLCVNLGLVMRA